MKIGHIKSHNQNRLVIFQNETSAIDANLLIASYYKKIGHFNSQERADAQMPSSLSQLLSTIEAPLEKLQWVMDIYEQAKKEGWPCPASTYAISRNHQFACPLDKIHSYRDFFTHEKHVKTGFQKRGEEVPPEWYQYPVYYKGAVTNFIGHQEEILWPSYTDVLDYELELGFVIGKDGYNIKPNKAFDHLFGMTILNDISARDIQQSEMKVRLGPSKGKDFCTVIGPWIVTMDEFKNKIPNMKMTASINGSEWSQGQSADAYYSIEDMIGFASSDEWLCAGDLLGSGTVGTGCGLELGKYPKTGDQIDLTIEHIGTLSNIVGQKRKDESWITSKQAALSANRPT